MTLAASELDANAGLVRISATSPAMGGSTSTTQRSPRHVTALIVTLAAGEAEAATSRAITGTRHSWRLSATTKTVKTTRFDPEDKTTLIALTLYNAAEPTRTGYIWNKYIDYSVYAMTDPWDCTNDIIIFRYADILLMEAEALAELKGAASAGDICNLIDQLRDRCGAGKVNRENYTTKENLINLVRNERRIELANEGLRYFDIIRWKQAELNTVKYGVGLVGPMYGAKMEQVDEKAPGYADPTVMVDGVKRRLVEQRYFNPARNYLFPIPQSERDLNTALTQNSGWD